MLERLNNAKKAVGTRKVLRSLEKGEISEVFLASDADLYILRMIRKACTEANVRITEVPSMTSLGEACGIEVKAAVAGILK